MIFVVYLLFYCRELPIVIGSSIRTSTLFDNLFPSLVPVENNWVLKIFFASAPFLRLKHVAKSSKVRSHEPSWNRHSSGYVSRVLNPLVAISIEKQTLKSCTSKVQRNIPIVSQANRSLYSCTFIITIKNKSYNYKLIS